MCGLPSLDVGAEPVSNLIALPAMSAIMCSITPKVVDGTIFIEDPDHLSRDHTCVPNYTSMSQMSLEFTVALRIHVCLPMF